MPWTETGEASALPINLADLKNNLRLTTSDEDGLLEFYAQAATDLFERTTGRRLISRAFRWEQPDFPADGCGIELPFAPIEEITSIQYYDSSGTLTTWDSDEYRLDAARHFPRVVLAPTETYPAVQPDRHDGVQVNFTAGYGSTYASVPKGIQMAIILLASHFFTHRLPTDKVPEGMANVVSPYRLRRA